MRHHKVAIVRQIRGITALDTKPATSTDTNSTSKASGQPPSRMHQMGHDYYNTTCPEHCDHADGWATRLITPRAFLNAARQHYTIEAVARALWATPGIVKQYIDNLNDEDWTTMTRLVGHELT